MPYDQNADVLRFWYVVGCHDIRDAHTKDFIGRSFVCSGEEAGVYRYSLLKVGPVG